MPQRPSPAAIGRPYIVMTLCGGCCGCGKFAVSQRFRGGQHPIHDVAQLDGRRARSGGCEITLRVVDRTRQHVQVVVQRLELGTRDHQLALAEFEFTRPLAGDPVPLAATLRTELAGASGAAALGQHPPTPPASWHFRHDETVPAATAAFGDPRYRPTSTPTVRTLPRVP